MSMSSVLLYPAVPVSKVYLKIFVWLSKLPLLWSAIHTESNYSVSQTEKQQL